ncbi:MAG TPA: aminoglycoside adenylyltransferase domain-containing protein [Anaerolineales bacterium]
MIQPTPYPDVNAILDQVLAGVQAILGDQFTGMVLYGSLALGDFDPLKSDIDFVVITSGELPGELLDELKTMHLQIASGSSKWAAELEGSYIPQQALRRYDPASAWHPHIDRGSGVLKVMQHHSDWIIQRYSLREYGVVLAGPDPKTLIDPIEPADLRQAVLDTRWWWEQQVQDTRQVASSGYQAYTILTMCRMLYTLEYGTIVSKPKAARWARQSLGGRWEVLIDRALDWQPGAPMDRLAETLDLIRFTLSRSQQ